MHSGTVDSYNFPKRGKLGSIIFVSGGLRSRYPLNKTIVKRKEIAGPPGWISKWPGSPHAAPQQSAHQGGVLQAAGAGAGPAAGDTPQAQQGDWTRKLKKTETCQRDD